MALPESRGSGRREEEGRGADSMLAKEPQGRSAGPARPPHWGAAGGRAPRAGEEGAPRRAQGLAAPRRPEDARTAAGRGRQVWTPVQSFQRRGSRRAPAARSCQPPEAASAAKSHRPPAPARAPRPPTGSARRRRALRPPARLPASAGCPPRAPLLLSSARARGGPRARSLRPAALFREVGRGAWGRGGASARDARCRG